MQVEGEGGREPRRTGGGTLVEFPSPVPLGSTREIQKGKNTLFISAYHPVKKTNPATIFDFHLTFSEGSNKISYARKRFLSQQLNATQCNFCRATSNLVPRPSLLFPSCPRQGKKRREGLGTRLAQPAAISLRF